MTAISPGEILRAKKNLTALPAPGCDDAGKLVLVLDAAPSYKLPHVREDPPRHAWSVLFWGMFVGTEKRQLLNCDDFERLPADARLVKATNNKIFGTA